METSRGQVLLSIARVRSIIIAATDIVISDEKIQDLIATAMNRINNYLGIDLSYGLNQAVVYRGHFSTRPQIQVYLPVTVKLQAPLNLESGSPSRNIGNTGFVVDGSRLLPTASTTSYYWFDRVYTVGSQFAQPCLVTFVPDDSVFPLIADAMLDLIRIRLSLFDLIGDGSNAIRPVTRVQDDNEEFDFEALDATVLDAQEAAVLKRLRDNFGNPRVG